MSGETYKITKHKVVMHLHGEQHSLHYQYFEAKREEGERTDGYYMTNDMYNDMGSPQTITITIQGGDRLNNPDEGELS